MVNWRQTLLTFQPHMHFLQAEMLWALLLAPMLVGFYLYLIRRRRRQVLAFSSLRLIHEAMASSSRWRRHLPPALVGMAFVLALLAMARPVARITLPADYMTLVMAMDVSRSMLATDVEPNRIQAAQKAAKEFLQALPAGVRVAIVSFAGTAQVVQHVSDRREDWVAAIDRFQLQRGTATGSGLLMALSTLRPDAPIQLETALYGGVAQRGIGEPQGQSLEDRRKSTPPKEIVPVPPGSYTGGAIVLLSDGRRTTGPDPIEAAKLAANLGVRVYTVGFGTPNGFIPGYEGYSFFTQVDEETLKAVANVTEAEYFKAGSADELKKIYEHLSTQFTLERKDTEISALLAGAAFLLMLLALGLSVRWFRAGAPKLLNPS
jgi:Ca-activated chloride channel family protein